MIRSPLEVAEVVRHCGAAYQRTHRVPAAQQRVLNDIVACRTAALGGHVQQCDGCGHRQIAYNSCRNRHCPKCQAAARAEWMAAREQELLPVPYFHLVFTLPQQLSSLSLQNKKIVYGILFRSVAQTLQQVAADPQHLGAQIGFLAMLHTWGQNLMHHPHLHVVIPGGGLSPDGSKWIGCKRSRSGRDFFLPVRILSRVFRGKFVANLKKAYAQGELEFHGQLQSLKTPQRFEQLVTRSVQTDWVVYAKRPFGGPRQVLKYLARYTHRVAISNGRLLRLEQDRITFRCKDYADGQQTKTMTLDATEFLRRFLLHVLPRGFVRIRHYGLLANRDRTAKLARCRELLNVATAPCQQMSEPPRIEASAPEATSATLTCPACGTGRLITIELVPATQPFRCPRPHFLVMRAQHGEFVDTS